MEVDADTLTPVERCGDHWVKRDDLFQFAGCSGGEVRCVLSMAMRWGTRGLVTAALRGSQQCVVVARVAKEVGLPCRVHCATGRYPAEVQEAMECGAEVVRHGRGYEPVITTRAREDAESSPGWVLVPDRLEGQEMVDCTAPQVANLPDGAGRVVVSVGSGMTLAGVLWGLRMVDRRGLPVVGVVSGADPRKRLDRWAPRDWRRRAELVQSIAGCDPHLRPDDVLWVG